MQTGISHLCLIASMTLVGINVALGKMFVTDIPIGLLSAFRFGLATIVLMIVVQTNPFVAFRNLGKAGAYDLLLQAIFGVFLFPLFIRGGLHLTTATNAGIITGAIPVVIGAAAWFVLRERPLKTTILAAILASCGIATINLSRVPSTGTSDALALLGNLLIICAVLCEAMFTIFAKRMADRMTPLNTTLGVNMIGLGLFIPYAACELLFADGLTHLARVSPQLWALLLYYILTASIFSPLLWYSGVGQVTGATAGVFTGIMPISAVLTAIIALGEQPSFPVVVGIGFILTAILVSSRSASTSVTITQKDP